MKTLVLVLVLVVWPGATVWAVSVTPERSGPEAEPDLAYDPHWLLRTPPNPVVPDALPARPTTTRHTTPAPTMRAAAPRPPRAPNTAGVEQWRPLVSSYPGWPVETMLAIMRCESRGNAGAVGSRVILRGTAYRAYGLYQLLYRDGQPAPGWDDPATNVRLAYEMKYVPSGLRPWDASRRCWS